MGPPGVYFINQMHDFNIRIRFLDRTVIYAGTIDFQEFSLFFDGDPFFFPVQHFTSFFGARRVQQIFFNQLTSIVNWPICLVSSSFSASYCLCIFSTSLAPRVKRLRRFSMASVFHRAKTVG